MGEAVRSLFQCILLRHSIQTSDDRLSNMRITEGQGLRYLSDG